MEHSAADPDVDTVIDASPKGRPIQLTDEQLLSIAFRADPDDLDDLASDNDNRATVDEDRPSDILRLTSWGMTGAVASMSAADCPVPCGGQSDPGRRLPAEYTGPGLYGSQSSR